MFCPNSADWGNVADWISGLGSFAAVAVALWIAGKQNRIAAEQRASAREAERSTRRSLICEVMRLTAEIQNEAAGRGRMSEVVNLNEHLSAMSELSKNDPQLFGEITMTVRASNISSSDRLHNNSINRMGVIASDMQKRQKVFEELLKD